MTMGSNYKAIIYDCDGVMFDSMAANLAFYDRVMQQMGAPLLDRDNAEHMRVLHTFANREVLRYFFPDDRLMAEAVRHAGNIDYRELFPFMLMETGFRETHLHGNAAGIL
jgi:phosphoglycolate phosphatase